MNALRTLRVDGARYVGGARERLWSAARRLQEFGLDELLAKVKVARRFAVDYLAGLESAGYLQSVPGGRYRLVRDIGVEAPMLKRDGREIAGHCMREALWRTAKLLGGFTVAELAVHASTERCPVIERDAVYYLRALVNAGYVVAAPGEGRRMHYRFLPSRNTGPRPPIARQVLQIYDPNEDRVVWQAGGES